MTISQELRRISEEIKPTKKNTAEISRNQQYTVFIDTQRRNLTESKITPLISYLQI